MKKLIIIFSFSLFFFFAFSPNVFGQISHCLPLGNIDCSGSVSVIDLSYLISNFGTNNQSADLDDSSLVNTLDLSILLSNFGKSAPSPTPTNIPQNGAIIIDHNSIADFDRIPDNYLQVARNLRVMLRHASIGEQINIGLNNLQTSNPTKYNRSNWSLQNRGNPAYSAKISDFVEQTVAQINQRDVFMFKYCFIDYANPVCYGCSSRFGALRDGYLQAQTTVGSGKKVVWWTMPLTQGTGYSIGQEINQNIRDYVRANNLVLFDIADIENFDRDTGQTCTANGLTVACSKYCAEAAPGPSCHLEDSGQYNQVEAVSKAFWVLMARIAGWN